MTQQPRWNRRRSPAPPAHGPCGSCSGAYTTRCFGQPAGRYVGCARQTAAVNRCARTGMAAMSLGPPASGGCPDWMKAPALAMPLRHLSSGLRVRPLSVWSSPQCEDATNLATFVYADKSEKLHNHSP